MEEPMLKKSFSIGDTLKKGWKRWKEQPFHWIGALLIIFLVSFTYPWVVNWLEGNELTLDTVNPWHPENNSSRLNFLIACVTFLYFLVKLGFYLGLLSMAIHAADDLPVQFSQLFSRFKYALYLMIAQILYSLIIFAGLILLIFPAFIWGAKFSLFAYFIADRGAGPIESLKLSAQATDGAKWDIFGLTIVTLLLCFAGFAFFIVGLLIAIPIVVIAWAVVYRRLTTQEARWMVS